MTTHWKVFSTICVMLCLSNTLLSLGLAHKIEEARLHENLGPHTYPISTKVPRAQQYFDQGLILAYGFNHAEAAQSFLEAARLDPSCAMCFWGQALVVGPNINAPMDPFAVPVAYAAVQKALELSSQVTKKEQALIQAVATRYSKDVADDRSYLDIAYADAMRAVNEQFQDDAVVASLFAEALMDLHPWDFWSKQGEAKPWTPEIIDVLEKALQANPHNPLANHLYIHTLEASSHPEKALPSAKRLATLVPGSGHLVHMPAHIYIRIGHYRDAALANQQAVKVDQHYLNHSHIESLYTAAYVPHNYHFLWAAAAKTGQASLAIQAAKDTAARVSPEGMRDPGFAGTYQHFWLMPLYTKALFGKWADIIETPAPPVDLIYPTAVWHYARGLAFLRQGHLERARKELTALQHSSQDSRIETLSIFDLNKISAVLAIAEAILSGEIEAARGSYDVAIAHLTRAVELEDGLNYTEPKDWYLPPRQVLGAVLLEAGKAAEAAAVYRVDLQHHPQNGWSLYGLVQSLQAQGNIEETEMAQQKFNESWADADVTLTSSRY